MKNEDKAARSIADVSAGTILAQVDIAAPIERVFAALTQGDEIVKWWGSDELYKTTDWVSELRPHGPWKSTGVGADGTAFSVEGEYLVVDPPHRVTFTWKPSWEGGHSSTVSYRLEAVTGGTRLVLRHDGLAHSPESCKSHASGWQRVLNWVSGHAAAPAPVTYVLCRLVPPRPDFATSMSPAEKAVMGAHVAYCKSLLEGGKAVLFGPVADPAGVWGCGLLSVADDAEARALLAADPAVTSGIGARYEILPFIQVMR